MTKFERLCIKNEIISDLQRNGIPAHIRLWCEENLTELQDLYIAMKSFCERNRLCILDKSEFATFVGMVACMSSAGKPCAPKYVPVYESSSSGEEDVDSETA